MTTGTRVNISWRRLHTLAWTEVTARPGQTWQAALAASYNAASSGPRRSVQLTEHTPGTTTYRVQMGYQLGNGPATLDDVIVVHVVPED